MNLEAPMDFEKVFGYFQCLHNQSCRLVGVSSGSENFLEIGPGLCANILKNLKIIGFSGCSHITICLSRESSQIHSKHPPIDSSDCVDNENIQKLFQNPSELRDTPLQSWCILIKIYSFVGLYNGLFIWRPACRDPGHWQNSRGSSIQSVLTGVRFNFTRHVAPCEKVDKISSTLKENRIQNSISEFYFWLSARDLGGGREVVGKWSGSGREVVGKWSRSGREVVAFSSEHEAKMFFQWKNKSWVFFWSSYEEAIV